MNKHSILNCLHILLYLLLSFLTTTMANESTSLISRSNNNFASKLYQILSKKEGNVFFSPISAHAVLSLAYQGAAGNTAKAFESALSVPLAKTTADGYKGVMGNLNSVENVTLHIANKVFVQENYKLKNSFKSVATDFFLSDAQNINFNENVVAAKKINDWVEDKTHNKIHDLISPGDLDGLTRLVLVNAVYFKGNWKDKFLPSRTTTEQFYTSETDSVDCKMMHAKRHYDYAERDDLDAKVLKMPYTNTDVSLVIILPNKRNGINDLEKKLANVDLQTLTDQMRNVEVDLSLPKFKIETTMELKDPLTELGLGIIFTESAEFPNLIETPEGLVVSKVIQKAFIEVNEEGAEAAAATGSVIRMRRSLNVFTLSFRVDKPFIFYIGSKNIILFNGKILKPFDAFNAHDEL